MPRTTPPPPPPPPGGAAAGADAEPVRFPHRKRILGGTLHYQLETVPPNRFRAKGVFVRGGLKVGFNIAGTARVLVTDPTGLFGPLAEVVEAFQHLGQVVGAAKGGSR